MSEDGRHMSVDGGHVCEDGKNMSENGGGGIYVQRWEINMIEDGGIYMSKDGRHFRAKMEDV